MTGTLSPADLDELKAAVVHLETPTFAARVADWAGQPVNAATRFLPAAVSRQLREVVKGAIYKSLELAVVSIPKQGPPRPNAWAPKLITGLTGGVGGFFGIAALPIELPITTTFMLRAIAEIAQAEGEDLSTVEARLACLEVFALGGRGASDKAPVDYYAVRTVLTKLTGEVAALVMERGALNASSPIVARIIGEIAGRFGLIVTERFLAGAVPVLGAVSGAGVNVIFMDHFQRIARGHFVVRRLERDHGVETIRDLYHAHAAKPAAKHQPPKGPAKVDRRAAAIDG